MRRVAHVSDLHFGRSDPVVVAAIEQDLHDQRADVVVVSGDLTQRARRRQFDAARRFLDGLGIPWTAVPGNHDIPLWDVARRAIDPFGRYRRRILQDLEPAFLDDELALLGLNTVMPSLWKEGAVRRASLLRLQRWSVEAGERARIVFAHHPFTRAAASSGGGSGPVRRWRQALAVMEAAGVDVVLTGHHHLLGHSETHEHVVGGPRRLIIVRAGTSTSHRRRGEPNGYTVLHVGADRITVEGRACIEGRFVQATRHGYRRIPWRDLHEEGPAPPLR
ncbi:MAG TPA: metallophosphoesterase [Candidatus Thermoplasmatota archaeon]|nr:metallophosphoesterase [Candidatus Thermoplasmatota archaeon]